MESAVNYLKSKGVEIIWGPVKSATSIRAKIKDPDGIAIELREWLKGVVKNKFYR